jgi:hypothetical protein
MTFRQLILVSLPLSLSKGLISHHCLEGIPVWGLRAGSIDLTVPILLPLPLSAWWNGTICDETAGCCEPDRNLKLVTEVSSTAAVPVEHGQHLCVIKAGVQDMISVHLSSPWESLMPGGRLFRKISSQHAHRRRGIQAAFVSNPGGGWDDLKPSGQAQQWAE